MKHFILQCLFASSALAGTANWSGSGSITFSGTSTLHDWAGTVPAKPFVATVTTNDAGELTHAKAKVVVEASAMNTAEPKRDENMRKAMQASAHPLITGQIDANAAQMHLRAGAPSRLPLTLTLLGKAQQVQAEITQWKATERAASFDLDFEASMKASGIRVPPVLYFIRVGDAVKVHATVTLTRL